MEEWGEGRGALTSGLPLTPSSGMIQGHKLYLFRDNLVLQLAITSTSLQLYCIIKITAELETHQQVRNLWQNQ